jgi:hypothetical protein
MLHLHKRKLPETGINAAFFSLNEVVTVIIYTKMKIIFRLNIKLIIFTLSNNANL